MKKIVDYKLVKVLKVTEQLADGWQPFGCIVKDEERMPFQPMVMYEDLNEKEYALTGFEDTNDKLDKLSIRKKAV